MLNEALQKKPRDYCTQGIHNLLGELEASIPISSSTANPLTVHFVLKACSQF